MCLCGRVGGTARRRTRVLCCAAVAADPPFPPCNQRLIPSFNELEHTFDFPRMPLFADLRVSPCALVLQAGTVASLRVHMCVCCCCCCRLCMCVWSECVCVCVYSLRIHLPSGGAHSGNDAPVGNTCLPLMLMRVLLIIRLSATLSVSSPPRNSSGGAVSSNTFATPAHTHTYNNASRAGQRNS